MKRFVLCLLVFAGFVIPSAPAATAEILKLPCGSSGATYSLQLPEGLAQDGNTCEGTLVMDNRVKIIGEASFRGSKLSSVTLPNSIVSTGDFAFAESSLKSVSIPNTVTRIGNFSFASTQLTSLALPNSVTTIGDSAFADVPITSLIIPNSVLTIGAHAFINTKFTSLIIPNSVTSIGMAAFYKVPLTTVALSNSLTSISRGLFMNTELTSVVIPSSVESIESQAFYRTRLGSASIPNSVKSIGIGAFASTQLTSISVPDSVREIGYFAFSDNASLVTVSLPDRLTALDSTVFDGDKSLTNITYCGLLTALPVAPTCPPSRATELAAAKAAADKVIADQLAKAKAVALKAFAAAKKVTGTKCTKLATSSIFGSYKFKCIKSGKSLVWGVGVLVVKATASPTPNPKPTMTPTTKPTTKPGPMPTPASLTLTFPPATSVSAITRPPQSMSGINTQQFIWGGGMDPAFVTLGPKLGTRGESGAYSAKSGVNFEIGAGVPLLAPIDSRFIGFNNRNADYVIKNNAKADVEGPLNTPNDDLELCFESTGADWPGLIYCFYHLGDSPLLLGINKDPSCSNAKEWPGPIRAEGWQFFTQDNYEIPGDALSASCGALLGRQVKRGDVIAYAGTTGPFSQAPIKMKVPNKAINPTVQKTGNLNLHWVQGDVFFYWKCYSPSATFEPGVLAYPWECGGYKLPKAQSSMKFKYQN